MYKFEISDYTFSCIYRKMYNIAGKYLQLAWDGRVFPALIHEKEFLVPEKYTFSPDREKMYNRVCAKYTFLSNILNYV